MFPLQIQKTYTSHAEKDNSDHEPDIAVQAVAVLVPLFNCPLDPLILNSHCQRWMDETRSENLYPYSITNGGWRGGGRSSRRGRGSEGRRGSRW